MLAKGYRFWGRPYRFAWFWHVLCKNVPRLDKVVFVCFVRGSYIYFQKNKKKQQKKQHWKRFISALKNLASLEPMARPLRTPRLRDLRLGSSGTGREGRALAEALAVQAGRQASRASLVPPSEGFRGKEMLVSKWGEPPKWRCFSCTLLRFFNPPQKRGQK